MSNAPSDNFEKSIEREMMSYIGWLIATAWYAASRLMRDSSDSGLNGLIVSSMRYISAMTAAIADSPAAPSSLHNSTRTAVPMMASSRLYQPARATASAAAVAAPKARRATWRNPLSDMATRGADRVVQY